MNFIQIYNDIYLTKEEEVLSKINRKIVNGEKAPSVKSIIEYILKDPLENIIFMDIKLNIVSKYEASNAFVDTGYKTERGEPIFISLVFKNGIFISEHVGTLDYLAEIILFLEESKGNSTDVYNNIEFLKANYGNYKNYVDDWETTLKEYNSENTLGDLSDLFSDIDITVFPEQTEEPVQTTCNNEDDCKIESKIDDNTNGFRDVIEDESDDKKLENIVELPEIKTDKIYVYDYIPNKYYLVQCYTTLGTINFSLINNSIDIMRKKVDLYSFYVVQYNQGVGLGQLKEEINLRDFGMNIPERAIDDINEALNYIINIIVNL